jgi:hypothetical protein
MTAMKKGEKEDDDDKDEEERKLCLRVIYAG